MSNRRLAQILKKNERTAQRRTQKLRDLGYLELAERGGHRGDGTIAANVYELSLPYVDEPQQLTQVTHGEPVSTGHSDDPWAEPQHDTQVSPSDDSQHDTQVSLRDEPQHDKTAPQHDKTESQHDKTTSQHDTQVSAPSLNPSLIPSPNPIRAREHPPPNVETAMGNSTDRASATSGASIDGIGIEIEEQEQDQKRQEEARCKICYAYQSNHARWMAQLDSTERHEFVLPAGLTARRGKAFTAQLRGEEQLSRPKEA
jgi:hypothetical protein